MDISLRPTLSSGTKGVHFGQSWHKPINKLILPPTLPWWVITATRSKVVHFRIGSSLLKSEQYDIVHFNISDLFVSTVIGINILSTHTGHKWNKKKLLPTTLILSHLVPPKTHSNSLSTYTTLTSTDTSCIYCYGRQEKLAILISRLLLCMCGMYVASIYLDFH